VDLELEDQLVTSDQICALRQILGKTAEFNISTFHLFIDFKSAYDSIKGNNLFKAMKKLGIPVKLKIDKSNTENCKMQSKS
jgi:hypothetical protein